MSPPDPRDNARRQQTAILMVLGASATFTLAAASVKALGGEIPIAQVVMCRNLFALPILFLLLTRAGGLAILKPRNPWMHAQRIMWGMCGMVGAFAGYTWLPLATATVLGFTMPLFLTALSVLVLKERVGWRRWSAVGVGFAGVLIVARPGMGGEALPLVPVLGVLFGALAWALAMMSIRRMGEAGEHGVTIVIWFAIGGAVLGGLGTIPVWVTPDLRQWLLLAGIGAVSAVAQLLMTEGYRRGETTLLAPFEYAALLWTMVLGVLIWGEWPGLLDLVGFAVLVGAGLFIWWREVQVANRR
jgi:drug/metabolite transporter (DMT)-like permease